MALGVGRKELVMVGVLLVGVLLAVLNQTLLSPALPAIMGDLQVDATTVQWLTSGYSLVEAVVIPLSAYLIGRFTTRQLFISAFALFTAGSLAAAIAPNFWVLLLGRVHWYVHAHGVHGDSARVPSREARHGHGGHRAHHRLRPSCGPLGRGPSG